MDVAMTLCEHCTRAEAEPWPIYTPAPCCVARRIEQMPSRSWPVPRTHDQMQRAELVRLRDVVGLDTPVWEAIRDRVVALRLRREKAPSGPRREVGGTSGHRAPRRAAKTGDRSTADDPRQAC